jgi:hypothetical protein
MTGIPNAHDDSKPIVTSAVSLDVATGRPAPGQNTPSVYAAFWQARSGFFNQRPTGPAAQSDC